VAAPHPALSQSRFERQLTTLRDQGLKPLITGLLKTTITEQSRIRSSRDKPKTLNQALNLQFAPKTNFGDSTTADEGTTTCLQISVLRQSGFARQI
jgi:hypothetical protein